MTQVSSLIDSSHDDVYVHTMEKVPTKHKSVNVFSFDLPLLVDVTYRNQRRGSFLILFGVGRKMAVDEPMAIIIESSLSARERRERATEGGGGRLTFLIGIIQIARHASRVGGWDCPTGGK